MAMKVYLVSNAIFLCLDAIHAQQAHDSMIRQAFSECKIIYKDHTHSYFGRALDCNELVYVLGEEGGSRCEPHL